MTRQELEEINDQLQVKIEDLTEQVKEKESENGQMQERIGILQERLRLSETEKLDLRESLRTYQQQRQTTLYEDQEARKRIEEIKQIELNKLNEAAQGLAQERVEMLERLDAKELEIEARDLEIKGLKNEIFQARTSAEGWQKQAAEAARMLRESQLERGKDQALVRDTEASHKRALSEIERLRKASPYPAWIGILETMGQHQGLYIMVLLTLGIIMLLIHWIIGLIWH